MSKLAKALTAAAGNAGGEALYVEDVFSTYLYAGNGLQKYISNGINLGNDPIGDVYLSGDNKTGYGASGYTISTTGTVNIDTAVKHTGTGSYEFIGGTNNFLSWTDSTGLGSANFTIEFFARNINQNGAGTFSIGSTSAQDYAGLTIAAFNNGGVFISTSGTSWEYFSLVSLNFAGIDDTWHHYAITRSGSTVRAFKDGVLQGTGTMSGSIANKSGLVTLGKKSDSTNSIEGNIDEFRIVKGTALYVNDFTPPEQLHDFSASGEGGLVWHKRRTGTGENHYLYDTERGAAKDLRSNQTNAEGDTGTGGLTSFNSNGFTYGTYQETGQDYASWTFRKAKKFFDVVTYTGTGFPINVSHNLGSVPACIIVKRTNTISNWQVYHEGNGPNPQTEYLFLDINFGSTYGPTRWNETYPTDSVFSLGNSSTVNDAGATYVAYLFASDAGGFGDDGDESIIKCGSFTGNATVDVGFEPQWVMVKRTDNIGNWFIQDTMRGIPTGGLDASLFANLNIAESTTSNIIDLTATGFSANFGTGSETWIYIAIRRPMKTPESGTEVFSPVAFTGDGVSGRVIDAGFSVDTSFGLSRSTTFDNSVLDRIRGNDKFLYTQSSVAESTKARWAFDEQDGIRATTIGADGNNSGDSRIHYFFKRATGFFDVVAFPLTNGVDSSHSHNLGVTPELILSKLRSGVDSWIVYNSASGTGNYLLLNETNAVTANASVYSAVSSSTFNLSGVSPSGNYVSYLFATLDGVSKVGSYTGTGADLNVDCGFSAGARFILIKRTDSTGDWYVWDSARGIVAGNDPYLLFNTDAVEVTSTDYIDPLSSGFTVTSSAPAALNASGGTYIFLAIA